MDYKSLYGKYYLCPKWCRCIINFAFELTFVVLSRFSVFLLHLRPRKVNKSPLCSNNLPGVIGMFNIPKTHFIRILEVDILSISAIYVPHA